MKIALCIGHSPVGGVGTSTYILARGMREAGHQADILATDGQKGADYDRARRDGWPVEAICLGERWLRRRLEIMLERLSAYDVVINNHSTETQLVLPALPARIVRLSVIRSTNEEVIAQGKSDSPYLNALVGISPEVQRLLEKTGVDCRTEMIANSVMLTPTDNLPKLQQPVKLAYLGRLTDIDKNILLLPEIVEACRKKGLDCSLTVAGDGADREKLEKKIQNGRLADSVRLVGAISRDEVTAFFSKSPFGLFPSNYEGFGLSLVEAMGAGCVPIASDIPSYRWILGEDAETSVAPVKDAAAYADRIQALVSAPERYRQIQKRLQERQRERFSPASTVGGYLCLIEELCQTHDPARFEPVPFGSLPLPPHHRRRCSRLWWALQKIHDGVRKMAAL